MSDDLTLIEAAARRAGALAMDLFQQGLSSKDKSDGSPVTNADLAVDALLKSELRPARPDYGWLSEETADDLARLTTDRQFVVDPIDGTRALLDGRPWWSVAIAVVENHQAIAAVVHVPSQDETYVARRGGGAFLNGKSISASNTAELENAHVLATQAALDQTPWAKVWPAMQLEQRNSIAYRLALVASGAFDAVISPGRKWDWDVAAGGLIAQEAGAVVSDLQGGSHRFNGLKPQQTGLICAAPRLQPLILERCAAISSISTQLCD